MPDSPLSLKLLRELALCNGFSLDDDRLEQLLPILERGVAARQRFRSLDLGETEPATTLRLRGVKA